MARALTIHKEIVVGHVFTKGDSSPSIVAKMENSSFDSKPVPIVNLIPKSIQARKLSSFPTRRHTIEGTEPMPQTCVCHDSRMLAYHMYRHMQIGLNLRLSSGRQPHSNDHDAT